MYTCKIYLVYLRSVYAHTYINYNKSVLKFISYVFTVTFYMGYYKYCHI